MKTRIRSVSVVAALLIVGLSGATAGCGKYSLRNLKAMKAFKDANDHYRGQRWKEAASRYEDMVKAQPDYAATPDFTAVYFFLGNSYDNLWKPARKGEPENDAYMQKAIENYTKAAEVATNPLIKRRALEYLVAAYGSDKLNDPSQAEPVVQKMIKMDPSDPGAYFALAGIYENAGRYDDAEQTLLKARDAKPNEPSVYNAIGQYYNRQGEFEKTIEAYQKVADLDPNNPQSFHLIGGYYQDKASKDFRLTPAQKKDYNEKGIAAEDKALKLNPNYVEALVYKGILLRQLALTEKDPAKQKEMIDEADQLRSKAIQLGRGAAAAATPAAGAAGAKPTGK